MAERIASGWLGAGFLLEVEVVVTVVYHIDSDAGVVPNHHLDSSWNHFPFLPQKCGPLVGGNREELSLKVQALVEGSGRRRLGKDRIVGYPSIQPSIH